MELSVTTHAIGHDNNNGQPIAIVAAQNRTYRYVNWVRSPRLVSKMIQRRIQYVSPGETSEEKLRRSKSSLKDKCLKKFKIAFLRSKMEQYLALRTDQRRCVLQYMIVSAPQLLFDGKLFVLLSFSVR